MSNEFLKEALTNMSCNNCKSDDKDIKTDLAKAFERITKRIVDDGVNLGKATMKFVDNTKYEEFECHGCCGNGWIENSLGEIKICPICNGHGVINKEKVCEHKIVCPCPSCPDLTSAPSYPFSAITYCCTCDTNTSMNKTL